MLGQTVPDDFKTKLELFTAQGYRVLALACRDLTLTATMLQRAERADVEQELNFLGFVVMENCLKPETTPVIKELHASAIRCIMVTGQQYTSKS